MYGDRLALPPVAIGVTWMLDGEAVHVMNSGKWIEGWRVAPPGQPFAVQLPATG